MGDLGPSAPCYATKLDSTQQNRTSLNSQRPADTQHGRVSDVINLHLARVNNWAIILNPEFPSAAPDPSAISMEFHLTGAVLGRFARVIKRIETILAMQARQSEGGQEKSPPAISRRAFRST
jgi:hypothetical protein